MTTFHGVVFRAHVAIALILACALPAGADWRQVGYFQADGGNISVGNARVRLVTIPNIPQDLLESGMMADTAAISKLYPGWDYRGDLELHYDLTPQGWRQSRFLYSIGGWQKALSEDTVPASLGVFDLKGDRRARIPEELHTLMGADVPIVASRAANLDGDDQREWVVVVAGPWMSAERGARMKLSLVDRSDEQWDLIAVFPLDEPRRVGPLEVRDVTGDGKPDVVFRTFHETTGHFWVEVRIYSTHDGLPSVLRPPQFIPAGAPSAE